MKRERYGGAQVLRIKLLNWKKYFLDLENDHYEGLRICNNKIWELKKSLEWSNKDGRKIGTAGRKISQEDSREILELKSKIRNIEKEFKMAKEKLRSEKEERGELIRVYNEEKRNAEKLRKELKQMDGLILSHTEEAKKLKDRVRDLEKISENEMGEDGGEEIRKLRLALDGKINELEKFKEGYSNSKREHEKEKKRLHHKIEELEMRSQQGKKEDKIEKLEELKKTNDELSRWVNYVEDDLDSLILKMEKIEDDLNMKIGSRFDLQEETRHLVKFMKKTLERYCKTGECMTRVEDGLSLEDIENNIKKMKDQLRDTRSGSQKYQKLTQEMGRLEKKRKILENNEEAYNEGNVDLQEDWVMGEIWKFE